MSLPRMNLPHNEFTTVNLLWIKKKDTNLKFWLLQEAKSMNIEPEMSLLSDMLSAISSI